MPLLNPIERIDEFIDQLRSEDDRETYIALRRMNSILTRSPEPFVDLMLDNREKFDEILELLDSLKESKDIAIKTAALEVYDRLKIIKDTVEKPKRPKSAVERYYSALEYLKEDDPYKIFRGLKLLSSIVNTRPSSVIELEEEDPELKKKIVQELSRISIEGKGVLSEEAKKLLSLITFERTPRESPSVGESEVVKLMEAISQRLPASPPPSTPQLSVSPLSTPSAPPPTVAQPQQVQWTLSRIIDKFINTKYLSALFIGEGIIFLGITGFMYTANIGFRSINILATVAFYCLILGVVFRMIEDYYGSERIKEVYERHSFEFNLAKLFVVINGIFFLFVAVLA
ncbi:hypothetical protein DRN72_01965 [Methanosarcinales archaeon]|nr:MAG: hypothetical protein DRN72_01965 [Methanosarcinales archaeon]